MAKNELEQRVVDLEAAVRCLVTILNQPRSPMSGAMKTSVGPEGKVYSVPQLFPALERFAPAQTVATNGR